MRKIKFRAWDEEDERMYCDDKVIVTFRGFLEEVYVRHGNTLFELIDYKLMQSTGLKDKNGKDVYEGDILSIDGYSYEEPEFSLYGEVKYGNCGFCIDDKFDYNEPVSLSEIRGSYTTIYEVVGNIYENPELLG